MDTQLRSFILEGHAMFHDLVYNFTTIIREHHSCLARLYIDGLATQAFATYLPSDVMEIRGLPSDLPPYLRFESDSVYLLPGTQNKVVDEEEAGFYQLYRTWDPRVVARAEPREQPVPLGGRWKAYYDIDRAISLHPEIKKQIKKFVKGREMEFVADEGRLGELSQWDFSERPTRFTLVFEYPEIGRRNTDHSQGNGRPLI